MHSEFNIFYTKFPSYLRARTRYGSMPFKRALH